jgi:hypothetical protein
MGFSPVTFTFDPFSFPHTARSETQFVKVII